MVLIIFIFCVLVSILWINDWLIFNIFIGNSFKYDKFE